MLQVQVTPYIKKFVDSRLGHPVRLHNKTTSHILLRALLFQTAQLSLFADKPTGRVLPCTVYIDPPKTLDGSRGIATRLRLVNQFFECLFLEEMKRFIDQQPIKLNRRSGEHNIKVQLWHFCEQFKIEVEEDITEDALVKMFYRYREWLKTEDAALKNVVVV
jgi:hypothetical protein